LLFSTFGFPVEMTVELAKEKGLMVDEAGFQEEFKKHQEISKAGAEQKFKGGLGGHSEKTIAYHTATHLLHQALHEVLGSEATQKGSNITDERLRFDFAWGEKMTDEQKKKVEAIVNEKIQANLPVQNIVLPKDEALATGATHLFSEKYPDQVSIYFVGQDLASAWSKEFCGGPHTTSTGVLGHFKITKEEAVAAGTRRIKAVLE
jgi:alanyl-tRNA synthetase